MKNELLNDDKKGGVIITITSGKGGVGKSTTSANIATGIALEGKKTLVIDFDIGLRNLDMILGLEKRVVYNVIDVMEGKQPLNKAIITTKNIPNLYFLPASQSQDKDVLNKEKVIKLFEELKHKFDYIIVDSPAGIEDGFFYSILMADIALIVANPEVSSIRDADRAIGLIDAKSHKSDLEEPEEVLKYLIVNRIKPEMVEKGEMLNSAEMKEILAIDMIGLVPDDDKVIQSTNYGTPIVIMDPKNNVSIAYRNIAKRLVGQDVPFMEIKKVSKFRKILNSLKG